LIDPSFDAKCPFVFRTGEVGKEMYIVNRGRLQVVADNGRTVLATLKAGSYFGEISILNMGTAGRSLGEYVSGHSDERLRKTHRLISLRHNGSDKRGMIFFDLCKKPR
jgi:CRP-like cAMP-binding protein